MLKLKLNRFNINFLSAGVKSRAFLSFLFSILLWVIVTARFYFTDKTVPFDSKSQFYNFFKFVANSLDKGEFPLWNPYSYSGFPSIADPQSFIFNPFFLAFAKFMPQASIQAFDAFVLLHVAAGSFFMQLLARKFNLSITASFIVGTVFFFAGPAMSRLQHVGLILSYAQLPLCFWLLTLTFERKSYVLAAIFAIFAAIMAIGRDQVALLNCLLLLAYTLSISFSQGKPLEWFKNHSKILLLIAIVGIALLFYPLLLTLQFATLSNRPAIELKDALQGSLDISNILTLAFANFFASLSGFEHYWGAGAGNWWISSATDSSVNYLYLGALPALCVVYAIASKAIWYKNIRFFTLTALFMLLYAVGRFTPLYGWLFDIIPLFKLYRRPADATFLLIFALSFIVGVGFDAMREKAKISKLAIKTISVIVLLLTIFSFVQIGDWHKLIFPLIAVITFTIIAFTSWKWRRLAVIILLMDVTYHSSLMPVNSDNKSNYGLFNNGNSADKATLAIIQNALKEAHLKGNRPRVEILGPQNGWQNAGMSFEIENTLGYNPLRLHGYEDATGASETAHEPLMRPFPKTFRGYRSKLARLLGIEYLVFDTPLTKMPSSLLRSRLQVLQEGPPYWVYKLPQSAPRVQVVGTSLTVNFSEILKTGQIPDFDLTKVALVEEASNIALENAASGQAEITQYLQNRVFIVAESDHPALLVLHDIHYPGWEVYVNGEKRALVKANILFRAVEIASGRHSIEFRYNPFGLDNIKAALTSLVKR